MKVITPSHHIHTTFTHPIVKLEARSVKGYRPFTTTFTIFTREEQDPHELLVRCP